MAFVSLKIPYQYITAEILNLLSQHFECSHEVFESEKNILIFEDKHIARTQLLELENTLVERKAPFDRYIDNPECARNFRPGKYDEEPIDVEINYLNGKIMIAACELQKIINQNLSPTMALEAITQLLDEVEPQMSSLDDWIGIAAPMVSTAEVEMGRFSDIL